MSANVFISFASQDRKVAMTLCSALENRGFNCWISARDILPGENFQTAIVKAIRNAKIMLLVFTANSNTSEEMTKELALASQFKVMVVPLRIEDVAPSDAFAYEFATRQWIDFFSDWELAIQQLARRIEYAVAQPAGKQPVIAEEELIKVAAPAAASPLKAPPPPAAKVVKPEPAPPAPAPAAPKPAAPAAAAAPKPAPAPKPATPKTADAPAGNKKTLLIAAGVVGALVVVGGVAAAIALSGKGGAPADEPAVLTAEPTPVTPITGAVTGVDPLAVPAAAVPTAAAPGAPPVPGAPTTPAKTQRTYAKVPQNAAPAVALTTAPVEPPEEARPAPRPKQAQQPSQPAVLY